VLSDTRLGQCVELVRNVLGIVLYAVLDGVEKLAAAILYAIEMISVVAAAAAGFYLVCLAVGFCTHLGWILIQ